MPALAALSANVGVRIAYGIAVLIAPSRPIFGRIPLAPDTDRSPEARLFVRGFASHQIAVGLLGFASLARPRLRRPAMELAAATDLADIASALIEKRARAGFDRDLSGGIAFSAAGLVSALVGRWSA